MLVVTINTGKGGFHPRDMEVLPFFLPIESLMLARLGGIENLNGNRHPMYRMNFLKVRVVSSIFPVSFQNRQRLGSFEMTLQNVQIST